MANLKFAVLGTGNSGQCFAADIALKGYSVNLAEIPEFATNLEAIEKKVNIENIINLPLLRRIRRMNEDIGEDDMKQFEELRVEMEKEFSKLMKQEFSDVS